MHVHGHPTNFNAVDLSSTRTAEKAVSAQRAGDVRGQLLQGGMDVEGEMNPFESFMVGREPEGSSRQRQSRDDASAARRSQAAEEEQASGPLSFWV